MSYKLYGIPNCNTVKKAKDALESKGIEFEFVNFKKTPPNKTQLKRWKSFFQQWPVNRKGPTFRKYKELFDEAGAPQKWEFMIENTSMIKRPILEKKDTVIAMGYDETVYSKLTS